MEAVINSTPNDIHERKAHIFAGLWIAEFVDWGVCKVKYTDTIALGDRYMNTATPFSAGGRATFRGTYVNYDTPMA